MHAVRNSSFRVFDAIIRSNIDLPELDPCAASATDFSLVVAAAHVMEEEHCWFHHWYQDEAKTRIDASVARSQGGYRLRFCGQADFLIRENGRSIVCEPCVDVPPETIRHLLLDQVLPRILGHRGELVVHASAIEVTKGEGIAFVGKSGWGKSTLASSFRAEGAELMGDDCLKLKVRNGKLAGVSAYGGIRLWDDSMESLFPLGVNSTPVSHLNSKRRIVFRRVESREPVVFKALFFLESPDNVERAEPIIHAKSGCSAAVELIRRSFLLDVKCGHSATSQFGSIGELLATCPLLYSLQYPREYVRLPEVRRAILSTVNGLDALSVGQKTTA